jgi:hypothetical protein
LPPQLEAALAAVADALAELPEAEWDDLCAEEVAMTTATFQLWEAMGWPEEMLPERVLGARILAHFAARYPALARDVAGTA